MLHQPCPSAERLKRTQLVSTLSMLMLPEQARHIQVPTPCREMLARDGDSFSMQFHGEKLHLLVLPLVEMSSSSLQLS